SLLVSRPWVPEGEDSIIVIKRNDEQKVPKMSMRTSTSLYALEAATVADYIKARQAPQMSWQDTLGNMKTLDRWRASVGMSYAADLI
ncbi:MAG: oxidoreductase, partial [Chloroflexi bacterium]|nr:oxidoreductase [Chloroflexota bacterium]